MDNQNEKQLEIEKKLDLTNIKDLPKYIWLFMYLFNKEIWETTRNMRIGSWNQLNRKNI